MPKKGALPFFSWTYLKYFCFLYNEAQLKLAYLLAVINKIALVVPTPPDQTLTQLQALYVQLVPLDPALELFTNDLREALNQHTKADTDLTDVLDSLLPELWEQHFPLPAPDDMTSPARSSKALLLVAAHESRLSRYLVALPDRIYIPPQQIQARLLNSIAAEVNDQPLPPGVDSFLFVFAQLIEEDLIRHRPADTVDLTNISCTRAFAILTQVGGHPSLQRLTRLFDDHMRASTHHHEELSNTRILFETMYKNYNWESLYGWVAIYFRMRIHMRYFLEAVTPENLDEFIKAWFHQRATFTWAATDPYGITSLAPCAERVQAYAKPFESLTHDIISAFDIVIRNIYSPANHRDNAALNIPDSFIETLKAELLNFLACHGLTVEPKNTSSSIYRPSIEPSRQKVVDRFHVIRYLGWLIRQVPHGPTPTDQRTLTAGFNP